eukprot:TRINITY_DN419_c0_g1_i3.p1 TRINITY_DN419_c0_g1~~TRINITY_DN419_c0_g1_i3.p1  ORF type:complete len:176 (+),score=75.90 TRINITY_DN419_c0_g1_i3:1520-2047(+)
MRCAVSLVQDQYGNYVIQHVLEHGRPQEKAVILGKMRGQIVQLSQHKFASNVVEKCVEFGSQADRTQIIHEILNGGKGQGDQSALVIMMKDQFANYVIQKVLDVALDDERELLMNRIRPHITALKKFTYGKHIIARVQDLMMKEQQQQLQQHLQQQQLLGPTAGVMATLSAPAPL